MLKYILVCILAMSGYYAWTIFPISHGPGVLTPEEPTMSYTAWEKPFNLKGNTLEPVKGYTAEVRILKHKRYFFDERKELSPVDVVVGWNEMSDERNLNFVQFSISNRTFDLNYTKPPIPAVSMFKQMELIHLIPSTKEIESEINWLRAGNIVRFEGKLVNVESGSDFNWNSEFLQSQEHESKKLILWIESLEIL